MIENNMRSILLSLLLPLIFLSSISAFPKEITLENNSGVKMLVSKSEKGYSLDTYQTDNDGNLSFKVDGIFTENTVIDLILQ